MGKAKAIQLKAALNLGFRVTRQNVDQKFRVVNPLHAYHYIKDELHNEKRELILVLLQDHKGYALSHHIIATGTLTQALVRPRDVFHPAIRHKASSLILIHNHPSGDPKPSQEDLTVTRTLVEAGHLIDIPLNDHLVIGHSQYVSLRQDFKHLWNYEEKI